MHTHALHHRPPRQHGFSLIEVLIAMLVLAIGLLGMAQMQASGIRSTHGAYLRTQATLLAGDMLDSMRANMTVARNGGYDVAFGGTLAGGTTVGDDVNAWQANLAALLPNGQGQITTVLGGPVVTPNNIPSDVTVAVRWTGLRQGEKLYEELLIGENTTGTQHPRIMRNSEPLLPLSQLSLELAALERAIEAHDLEAIEAILKRTVEGYSAEEQPFDPFQAEAEEWAPISRTLH